MFADCNFSYEKFSVQMEELNGMVVVAQSKAPTEMELKVNFSNIEEESDDESERRIIER